MSEIEPNTGHGPTWPYPSVVDERLRTESVSHFHEFSIEHNDESIPLELMSNASLTFDENWAPYAQFSGDFQWLPEQTIQSFGVDEKTRVRVKAGYGFDFRGKYVHDMAVLNLRSIVQSVPKMGLNITAASSEVFLQDKVYALTNKPVYPTNSAQAGIAWVLQQAKNTENLVAETPGTNVPPPSEGVAQGQVLWDVARDIAAAGKVWLFNDGLGTWRIKPRPVLASDPKTVLQTGAEGTIISYQIGRSREAYADGVIVKHSWGSADNQTVTGVASVEEPTRWKVLNRDTAITKPAADEEAKGLLGRLKGVVLSIEVEAKAAYWLRPGDFVQVRIPGVEKLCRVSRVQFSFPAGRMNVRLIDPDTEVEE